jgi:hypothetical protein
MLAGSICQERTNCPTTQAGNFTSCALGTGFECNGDLSTIICEFCVQQILEALVPDTILMGHGPRLPA